MEFFNFGTKLVNMSEGHDVTLQMGVLETSMILSAVEAKALRSLELMEARTILTLPGRHWRNSSLRKEASVEENLLPKSCCIWHSNWLGLRSPRSLLLNNCWSLHCSDAAVR